MSTGAWIATWIVCVAAIVFTGLAIAALHWQKRATGGVPPWYVRLVARIMQHPLDPPLEVPDEPEGIRLVHLNGMEIHPVRVVYVGPDPEEGIHEFEAWFSRADFPPSALVTDFKGRIARLPGRTGVAFRLED